MSDDHVYACLLVHGAPVYVRFTSEAAYQRFLDAVDTSTQTRFMESSDGTVFMLRPSAVDAVFKGATPNAV